MTSTSRWRSNSPDVYPPYLLMSHQGGVELWDLDENKRLRLGDTGMRDGFANLFTLSSDGRVAAADGPNGRIGLYYVESLEHIRSLSAPLVVATTPATGPRTVRTALFAPDGRRMTVGSLIYTRYDESQPALASRTFTCLPRLRHHPPTTCLRHHPPTT